MKALDYWTRGSILELPALNTRGGITITHITPFFIETSKGWCAAPLMRAGVSSSMEALLSVELLGA